MNDRIFLFFMIQNSFLATLKVECECFEHHDEKGQQCFLTTGDGIVVEVSAVVFKDLSLIMAQVKEWRS